jgi:CheY-like chemotaxis protein
MSVSILAVDDEVDVADMFRQSFRREVRQGQYVLHFARSAEEALGKLARGIEPELIAMLSDINMPGMDGLDLPDQFQGQDEPSTQAIQFGPKMARYLASITGAQDSKIALP